MALANPSHKYSVVTMTMIINGVSLSVWMTRLM
jgi:hypothetical protein